MKWGRAALVAALASCAQPRPIRAPVPPPPPPAVVAATPASIWPVAVRVMTWTDAGPVQLGELPASPPATPPTTAWYVEPRPSDPPLDRATFVKLVAAVRHERVPGLSLRGQPIAAWLGELRELPDLTALVLDDTGIDGAALAALGVTLQRIYLARTPIDDRALVELARTHSRLEVIDVEGCAIGDAGVTALATLSSVRVLNLSATAVTDAGGPALGTLRALEVLDLGKTAIADKTLIALRGLALRELFLDGTRATGTGIAQLAPLAKTIARLDVSGLTGKLTDAHLAWLASAANLIEAGLNGAQVHDPLVKKLLAIPTLRELRLAEAPITVGTTRAIAAVATLEVVDLASTVTDDTAAIALLALPRLRVLRLDQTKVTDAALRGSLVTSLVELYLSRTKLTDAGLAILDGATQLEALGLGETAVGALTIERIAKLTKLHTLVLSKVRPTSAAAFTRLATLTELMRLYLDDARIGDEAFVALAPLHKLRILHLAGSEVSEGSLATLHGFAHLEELTIGDTRMTAAVTELSRWPQLRTLSLVGLAVGDAALANLATHPRLSGLDLSSTELTDPSPLAALPRLRLLGLAQTKLSKPGLAAVKQLESRGVKVVR